MSKKEAINYWIRAAKRDRNVALDMFKSGHYNWSLFMWQLVIERLLKALILKSNQDVLTTHNLVHLAKLAGIEPDESLIKELEQISRFNLEARYEDYKEEFYHKATETFTIKWAETAEKLYQWLLKQI